MKKLLKLPITLQENEDLQLVTIDIGFDIIEEWCLALCLIEKDLEESIIILNEQGSLKIEISKDANLSQSKRGRVNWHSKEWKLVISLTELEMWIQFFLKYYRDSMAEVDHIDLDLSTVQPKKDFLFLLKATEFTPPVSAEEAKRRLDLF